MGSRFAPGIVLASALVAASACGGSSSSSPPKQSLAVPPASVYTDLGPTDEAQPFRALVGLPLRGSSALEKVITGLYTPGSATFRQYLKASDFVAQYGPSPGDVSTLSAWLTGHGFTVLHTAANNMLIEFSGVIGDYNKALATVVHTYQHTGDSRTASLSEVYAPPDGVVVPSTLTAINAAFLTVDEAADTTPISAASTTVDTTPPTDLTVAYVPAQITKAYGFDTLADAGGKGDGTAIGLVVADDFKIADAQSLWQTFGLKRASPTVKVIMEAPTTRVVETSLDVEWAGMLAPDASIIVYEAPDIRDTSMLFTFNEAVGLDETDVISDSFGHRETSVSLGVAEAYDDAARMAAAIGMTVVSATGDSGGVDAPSACPHVTAVGGSDLTVTADGTFESESAWFGGGAGESTYFAKPVFQQDVAATSKFRNVADLSLNAEAYYFTKYLGNWEEHGGTSFASPIFAAMVADADSYRVKNGKLAFGYLNLALYDSAQTQGVFRDITQGASGALNATVGWDEATGWGAPDALALAKAIP